MSDPAPPPCLRVSGLKTWFHTEEGVVKAVDDIDLELAPGMTLGVVGESGSGKSVTSLTIMQLLPEESARIEGGSVSFLGRELLSLSRREMSEIRGRDIAMIFQEPMTSLNPVFRVGEQVAEAIRRHKSVSRSEARQRTIALFREVGIPEPERRIDSYPHEMSGGQKQRVMIAMALSCDPTLLIADEPTTALDVTIQAQILELLRSLRDRRGMSILFITHDLGVIAEIADHVAVMFRGKLVEYGDVVSIFAQPRHPYTKGLLACRPRLETPYRVLPTVGDFMEHWVEDGELRVRERELSPERLAELRGAPRHHQADAEAAPLLRVRDLRVHFPVARTLLGRVTREVKAVDGISFDVGRGTTLGLVGESGCGKTTTGRALLGLIPAAGGTAHYDGVDLLGLDTRQWIPYRRRLQIIFQDPYASLNPRLTVEQAIGEPIVVHGLARGTEVRDRIAALMAEVDLDPATMRRYPHEFSGGQRQRICIARALALQPEFVVCDESVSALDVSVQAQVLNLLKALQEKRGLTYIFISHDLSVVKFMSDRMCVMRDGRIVEAGPSDRIYADPQENYTRDLIAAIPRDDVERIRARQRERAG